MYLFLFLNKIMFGNSILDGLFNIPQYESKRKPMFNDLDSIFKKEENTRPSIYKKDEIKGSAKKDIKQELPKKNMFEPKCGNSLTVLKDEYNKYNEFIYKNEVLIEQLKEENESAKKIQEQLSKKIKELEIDLEIKNASSKAKILEAFNYAQNLNKKVINYFKILSVKYFYFII